MSADEQALLDAEDAFNLAMISNDPVKISQCISVDWVLVTPESGPIPGAAILDAIGRRALVHDTMSKQSKFVRVFGDFGFVTGRGQNTGWFLGNPIRADEWITDIYRRTDGRWLCELTHLTPAAAMN